MTEILTTTRAVRVLLCTARADIGGGPEHILGLLADLQGDVAVACPMEEPYHAAYGSLVGLDRVYVIPSRSMGPRAQAAAFNIVRRVRPDVVHTHGKGAGALFRPLCRALGVPTMHTFHGLHTAEYGSIKRVLYRNIERWLSSGDAALVAVSSDEAQLLAEQGIAARPQVIPNGVIVGPRIKRSRVDRLRLVFAGRLVFQKDPQSLIDLVQSSDSLDATLTIFGDGPLRRDMQIDLTSRVPVDMRGEVVRPADHYGDLDVYVSAARWEGMPLAVLEALAAGLPCVLSDVPGHRQIAELVPEAVFLFERGDRTQFEKVVAYLAADHGRLEAASLAAVTGAEEHFDVRRVVSSLERLYQDVAARGRP